MKNLLFVLFIFSAPVFAQVEAPSNIILRTTQILGNASFSTTVKIDTNDDQTADYSVIVNYKGMFAQQFSSSLASGATVNVWAEDEAGTKSSVVTLTVNDESTIVSKLLDQSLSTPTNNTQQEKSINDKIKGDNLALKNRTLKHKVTVLNTTFSLPIARLNSYKDQNEGAYSKADFFTSLGAGIGITWGELTTVRDENGTVVDEELVNTFSIYGGLLFSTSGSAESKSVVAPTITISGLNLAVGFGYEFGQIPLEQRRFFMTLAYNIPLFKLKRGAYYILKSSGQVNETSNRNHGLAK